MNPRIFDVSDRWLDSEPPSGHVAVSSRARLARNLAAFPFAPHAKPDVLKRVDEEVGRALLRSPALKDFERIELSKLSGTDRMFLKESRLISKEMERGGEHLTAYVSQDAMASIMVNEEDHLRLQVMSPGLSIREATARLRAIDEALGAVTAYAVSERFGYLTACPSNVGTGFRASVMLHLPGLALLQDLESSLQGIAHYGLTVRGFEGEASEYLGDFFQISNEVTLGRTVDQILDTLHDVLARLVDREEEARANLFKNHLLATDDSIWRSFAILAYARRIDASEAMKLLSRIRLGIDRKYFKDLTHPELNRLVMTIQPAHLERRRNDWGGLGSGDEARARILRDRIRDARSDN